MAFPPKPRYSVLTLERASATLISGRPSRRALASATEVLNKWRACHAYPINTFQSTLRDKTGSFAGAIVAQRLKRATTIIGKLDRMQNRRLTLANMQDIGGVRAVLKTVEDVEKLRDIYLKSNLTHTLEHIDDYISRPKPDGYRGIHLIYRYNLNRPPSRKWNGLLIEMQLRTELQHYWATAVEVTGTILNEPFKFGGTGQPEWRDFFKLVSSAFAMIEKRPVVGGYENLTISELFDTVKKKEKALDALQKMEYYSRGLSFIQEQGSRKNKYHILTLDLENKTLTVSSFTELNVARASEAYAGVEKSQSGKSDTVLVSTAKSDDLRKAYPNYFLDVSGFTRKVGEMIQHS